MEKCSVGDKVQLVSYEDGSVKDGVVTNIVPPKKPRPEEYWKHSEEEAKEWTTFVDVKWDDDTESQHDQEDLEPQDSELERDFRKTFHYADQLIQAKLDEASAAINEAVKIAERYGVPFHTHVSPLSNEYHPRSLGKKFPKLDHDFMQNVSDTYNEYESTGWKRSAVC